MSRSHEQEPERGLRRKADVRIDKEQMRELRICQEIGDAIVAAACHQAVAPPQVELKRHPDFHARPLQLKDAERVVEAKHPAVAGRGDERPKAFQRGTVKHRVSLPCLRVTGLSRMGTAAGKQPSRGQINRLANRDRELIEGIATAAALAQPVLRRVSIRSGQHFGVTAGWGGFDNANAVAFSAAGILTDNTFRPGIGTMFRPGIGTVVLYGGVGVGTDDRVVTSRAGVSFGW